MGKRAKAWPPDHAGRLAEDLMHVAYEHFNPRGPGAALGLVSRGIDLQHADRARFTLIVPQDRREGPVPHTYYEVTIRRREFLDENATGAEQLELLRNA